MKRLLGFLLCFSLLCSIVASPALVVDKSPDIEVVYADYHLAVVATVQTESDFTYVVTSLSNTDLINFNTAASDISCSIFIDIDIDDLTMNITSQIENLTSQIESDSWHYNATSNYNLLTANYFSTDINLINASTDLKLMTSKDNISASALNSPNALPFYATYSGGVGHTYRLTV